MEKIGLIVGLVSIAVTMAVGFIGIFIMLIQTANQTRTEIREAETNLRNEFKQDLNTLEVKLNTLLLGLFRNFNPTVSDEKNKKSN